jgi:uncharacterized protein (DUF427 family)
MSLTFGNGPFGPNGGGGEFSFGPLPPHILYWEDWPRRMRALFAGETILDSRHVKLLHETEKLPAHYVPFEDLRRDLLVPSADPGAAPDQQGKRWSVRVGDQLAEGCVTSPPTRPDGAEILPGYVTVAFGAMDRWFEEDDPIYADPRDPYHRVDVRSSSRHVVVRHAGQVVAETSRPKLLFETSNPIRYYLPAADVRLDLLVKSETISECPYKGDGQHWHLLADAARVEDAAWSLPHPLPEGFAAAEHICFYPNKVEIEVDGQRVAA